MLSFFLLSLDALLAVPVLVFVTEVFSSIAMPRRDRFASLERDTLGRVAVLVPAHNESLGLLPTLGDINAEIRALDRLLVVADNCTDDTAAIALSAGAEVVERNEPMRRGKGFAIAWGLSHLSDDPPDIVIVIDADCRLAPGTIDKLTAACALSHRPVQANYVMVAAANAPVSAKVAEFAHLVKDTVRPLGLKLLGLPCQLSGTGMAFPWDVIQLANLASGEVVEDLKLGLDLALANHPPEFCPSATVTSEFPLSIRGIQNQRQRWEQGHIGMILAYVPRLVIAAIARANLGLLVLALDVAVPPLTLLCAFVIGTSLICGFLALLGISLVPMLFSVGSAFALAGSVFLAWLKYGREILPPRALLSVLSYALVKLAVYRRIVSSKSGPEWIRTDREKP
jgi:cellulose synthase/poly-beta-1,6-N-acetylglucosamine synthase-like glycosyltransferase